MYVAVRLVFIALAIILSGCGRLSSMLDEVVPDQRKDYTKAKTLPDLSIPPGLTAGAIRDKMSIPEDSPEGDRSYSDFQDRRNQRERQNSAVLTPDELQGDQMVVAEVSVMDDQHVIVVEAGRYELWQKIKKFWISEGFEFQLDDPDLGVLETNWVESKNNLQRNRFKIFAENGKEDGTIIVFLSHQKQDLVAIDQAYGEDYEWGEIGRDKKLEAAVVERLRSGIEIQEERSESVVEASGSAYNPTMEDVVPYNPSEEFARRMSPRKMRKSEEKPIKRTRDPEIVGQSKESRRDVPKVKDERATYDPSEEFAGRMNPRKMNDSSSRQSQMESDPAYSGDQDSTGVRIVSVGRGKYYLTLESGFNDAWKSTKQALRVANVSVRKADKGRGIFIVDLVEGGYGESSGWGKLRFWKTDKPAQYQVSVTGIGDRTEVVILDPDGRWITSHEAERLLDRIYNAIVSI